MKKYKICLIPGDGIGPDQTDATLLVLEAIQKKFDICLDIQKREAGDLCKEKIGVALPVKTVETIKSSDACLKGPVGETAAEVIIKLRMMLDLYANIRPIKSYPNVPCLRSDIDFVFVRENMEGVYKGIEFVIDPETAVCMRVITKANSERIARYAFELAQSRKKRMLVTAVHKANVMKLTCGLFAKTCREVSKKYPNVEFNELYVDNAAQQLIKRPQDFGVIVTTNMFGDILSDEAAMLVGGLGMAPGANIGDKYALFEPIHGSAPKYADKQIANPCSMILATGMMFNWLGKKHSDNQSIEASRIIEKAVSVTLKDGIRTRDLGGNSKTRDVGEAIAQRLRMK